MRCLTSACAIRAVQIHNCHHHISIACAFYWYRNPRHVNSIASVAGPPPSLDKQVTPTACNNCFCCTACCGTDMLGMLTVWRDLSSLPWWGALFVLGNHVMCNQTLYNIDEVFTRPPQWSSDLHSLVTLGKVMIKRHTEKCHIHYMT